MNKKRALIVDDDITTRFILKVMLEDYFDCDLASCGEKAICAFDEAHNSGKHYHLICLDITMPDISGLEVLKHIRETETAISMPPQFESKIMIISADSTSKTILDSFFSCGASAYITKPVGKNSLIKELTNLSLIF